MTYDFIKYNPAGNMTLLILSPVARAQQPRVAAALMDEGSVHAEQVGFVEPATLPGARMRLQMMGGEFCGNAAMCLGAHLARETGAAGEMALEISGARGLVNCRVDVRGDARGDAHHCALEMPLPARLARMGDVPVIQLPGIAHGICEGEDIDALRAGAPALAKEIAAHTGAQAAGVMLLDRRKMALAPLVYVPSSDTMVWERGCGSGTAAVGAYLALTQARDVAATLAQPGGAIAVSAAYENGAVRALRIATDVRIVAEGRAYL
ncbi:MAG: diaminopimelate epimerase [Christensenellales bacterium]